jgi:predicted Zn-dependent protease
MSRTLNLVHRLLARGRKFYKLGATSLALQVFTRLSGLRQLPPGVARRVQVHLAFLALRGRRFVRARRHLAALLAQEPHNPTFHYLMARAAAADRRISPERVLRHCRHAVQFAPKHAGYLSTRGILLFRHGQAKEGLNCLRQALNLAPAEPRVVRRVAQGLSLAGHVEEARAILVAALFRNAGDDCFRRLWNDFQFNQLHSRQQGKRSGTRSAEEGTNLLPFLRPAPVQGQAEVRVDRPAGLAGPHQRRSLRRHVQ